MPSTNLARQREGINGDPTLRAANEPAPPALVDRITPRQRLRHHRSADEYPPRSPGHRRGTVRAAAGEVEERGGGGAGRHREGSQRGGCAVDAGEDSGVEVGIVWTMWTEWTSVDSPQRPRRPHRPQNLPRSKRQPQLPPPQQLPSSPEKCSTHRQRTPKRSPRNSPRQRLPNDRVVDLVPYATDIVGRPRACLNRTA